jgi:hypothetical protein
MPRLRMRLFAETVMAQ